MCDILVSIVCNAYNHEKYIRYAIDSFLAQKTNFKFEILIHDDASTDKTAEIIKEYEAGYPQIIRAVCQKENQYSQGVEITVTYQYPRVRGRYIALCEGDDFWTDPYKLQKQVDALEKNTDVDICAHAASVVHFSTKKKLSEIAPLKKNGVIPVEKVIIGGGGFVATNSLMLRACLIKDMPEFVSRFHYDYAIQIYGSLRGGMLYLKDNMSSYRFMVPGAWSARTNKDTTVQAHYDKIFDTLAELADKDTGGKYSPYFAFNRVLEKGNLKAVLSKEYKDIFKMLPVQRRCKIRIRAWIPGMTELIRRLKNLQNE